MSPRDAASIALLAALSPLALGAERRGDAPDTPPRPAQEQRQAFHLPAGFEIQLVADESQIQKPMNLSFDSSGRLWVSGSALYPFAAKSDALGNDIATFDREWATMAGSIGKDKPAPPPAPVDTVRVLSDFGPDGRARKVEIFADKLNVPIGIQPLPRKPGTKGDAIVVYSIPNIWRMEDVDGDGRADVREALYTGFGFRDTHGMSSNYLLADDGWIYGCHGFANHSEVRDRTGRVTVLDSGNTYRFRPDGSAFEIYTHGQTNPFGLTTDPSGNLYSADSHSKPAYLLIRGGFYEGIGKRHDGLGFAPAMMQHSHGSSAIAGIAYYAGDKWPEEYRDNLFIGNPVTRRINRDRLEWHGSTPKAIEMPDFLTCDDPWFRPVQVKLGPDGALWIADFYNPIIGHYEQPLLDPRRDHRHGRIWRIVWRGAAPLSRKGHSERGPGASAMLINPESSLPQLLDTLAKADPEDSVLVYRVRAAVRDELLKSGLSGSLTKALTAAERLRLAAICLAVPNADAAEFLLSELQRTSFETPGAADYLRHVVLNSDPARFDHLARVLGEATTRDRGELAAAVSIAARERGVPFPAALMEWSTRRILHALTNGQPTEINAAIAALRDSSDVTKLKPLRRFVKDPNSSHRAAALEALMNLPEGAELATEILQTSPSLALRRKAAELIAAKPGSGLSPKIEAGLLGALPTAPTELAQVIAISLCKQEGSCAALLDAIEHGKAAPALLRHPFVAALALNLSKTIRDRIESLTKDLPPENARLDKVIAMRVAGYTRSNPDAGKGKAVFQQHCAVCHKFHGEGGSVAPNLDGVGSSRGIHRLAEDILDPNRNVDGTFRQVLIETHSGQVIAGVNLRQSPTALTVTDSTGKDVSVPRAEIKKQSVSPLSLMPPAFDQTIPPQAFAELLAYLLTR